MNSLGLIVHLLLLLNAHSFVFVSSASLSTACGDLIRQLLQVSVSRRIMLLEVMDHPWITKHGLYLLHPYRLLPTDHEAQRKVRQTVILERNCKHILSTADHSTDVKPIRPDNTRNR